MIEPTERSEPPEQRTALAIPSPLHRPASRRDVLRGGFLGAIGLGVLASSVALWNFLWPRTVGAFGGPVAVPARLVPKAGHDPVRIIEGKFWLMHLKPGEGVWGNFDEPGPGGLLALYQRCPHLGCSVPWQPTFNFEGKEGWFRCPCHRSTYTKSGIRVFGPALRPMDTMAIAEVRDDGSIVVNTGAITTGALDNAQRAVPYPFGEPS